ncbi:hypothetical protein KFU94_58265 [Chloroflexi bacterium TSY]|nr:hypothetical protein [Chloroflexi bacterium TSY]
MIGFAAHRLVGVLLITAANLTTNPASTQGREIQTMTLTANGKRITPKPL